MTDSSKISATMFDHIPIAKIQGWERTMCGVLPPGGALEEAD